MPTRRSFLYRASAATTLLASGIPLTFAKQEMPANTMPISIFSKHLQFLDYEEMAKAAKEIGFDGVDLTVRPGGHVAPERVGEELPRAAEAVRKAGLKMEMMTTRITSLESPHAEKILTLAAKEGVKYYRLGSYRYDYKLGILESIKRFQQQMKELADLNKELGIQGAYQNHAGTGFGSSVWDIHMAQEGSDAEWMGVQYDIKHATAEGGRSWPNGLALIKDRIHTLDIKDFLWQDRKNGWKDEHVPLGTGMVNFDAFFEKLKAYGMAPPISIHYEYDLGGADHGRREIHMPVPQIKTAMQRDLTYLRAHLAEAGL